MRLARTLTATAVAVTLGTLGLGLGAHRAAAQVALEEEGGEPPPPPPPDAALVAPPKTQFGVGVRVRNVRIPRSLIEAFVERSSGGSSNLGLGLELSRRKGPFEVQFGLEYEKIFIEPGIWIDKGDKIPADEPDYVRFNNFGWVTAEVSFMYHTPIIPQLSVRYGGGAGVGVFFGDVRRTDYVCDTSSIDSCDEKLGAENMDTPYDTIPPVFLVVNAVFGVQIKPTDEIFINLEGGLRTLPFFGGTFGYYF